MTLSEHIKHCQDLLDEHGDIDKFYAASDPCANYYIPCYYAPEIRYLSKDERPSRSGRVENLLPLREEGESEEEWMSEHWVDESVLNDDDTINPEKFAEHYTKVILL